MTIIPVEDYTSHASTMNNTFDAAVLGACEMDVNGPLDEIDQSAKEALNLGLTAPIHINEKSPATALLDQLALKFCSSSHGKTSKTRKRSLDCCTGILTMAISYDHHHDDDDDSSCQPLLSREQAQKAIELAWNLARSQPHEISYVRFWVDQMVPSDLRQQDDCSILLLPFYRLPVVSVVVTNNQQKRSKCLNGWLTIQNNFMDQSSFSSSSADPLICPFPASQDSAEYQVASLIIAGLLDGKEFSQDLKRRLLEWACRIFCQSKQMKKLYKINSNIDDNLGYGYFMGADWWWSMIGKSSKGANVNQRRYNHRDMTEASMIGMSSITYQFLSSSHTDEVRTMLAAFSHYTPEETIMGRRYYGTTFPMAYIWVNLSCDEISPYLNMEYIQGEDPNCPIRKYLSGSKKLGLNRRSKISNTKSGKKSTELLMQDQKVLLGEYLASFRKFISAR
mmetsp:Transcript_26426/g.39068  ORF Transcript_26426/g.39068 Transcript_26426/m.39068 type:complete len:450 (+) Transcript_26426:42-1391(+)